MSGESFLKFGICLVRAHRFQPLKAIIRLERCVAQPGSALAWGARGRRFESFHTDHMNQGLSAEML